MFVGAAAEVIRGIIYLASPGSLKTAILRARPNLTAHQLSVAQNVAVIEGVVGGLIGAGLFIWIALECRRGKNWARITGTVFFGLGVLSLLVGLRSADVGLNRILGLIVDLIGLVAVVLLWQRSSSEYFGAGKRPVA
jgi:hypothetical protein